MCCHEFYKSHKDVYKRQHQKKRKRIQRIQMRTKKMKIPEQEHKRQMLSEMDILKSIHHLQELHINYIDNLKVPMRIIVIGMVQCMIQGLSLIHILYVPTPGGGPYAHN